MLRGKPFLNCLNDCQVLNDSLPWKELELKMKLVLILNCHLLHYHGGLLGSYEHFGVTFASTSSLKMNLAGSL